MLRVEIVQAENGYVIFERGAIPGERGKEYVAETIEKLQDVIGDLADKQAPSKLGETENATV